MPIIKSFVDEENNTDKTDPCQDGKQPESPIPFLGREDESCEEGAKVRREDHEAGPDVDFAATNPLDDYCEWVGGAITGARERRRYL